VFQSAVRHAEVAVSPRDPPDVTLPTTTTSCCNGVTDGTDGGTPWGTKRRRGGGEQGEQLLLGDNKREVQNSLAKTFYG